MSKVKSYYGGSTSHYYTYNGSTLVQEKIVTSGSQTTEYLTFLYNSEGPTGFVYNNTLYTYRKNIFGDIIAVYNGTSKVAEYAYDAYGNCRVITGSNIGTLNPFRYRGYYFDEDMKLYYLQSRYYDPETGRFINADDVSYLDPETIHGLNLYAYCLNNPIMNIDSQGNVCVPNSIILLLQKRYDYFMFDHVMSTSSSQKLIGGMIGAFLFDITYTATVQSPSNSPLFTFYDFNNESNSKGIGYDFGFIGRSIYFKDNITGIGVKTKLNPWISVSNEISVLGISIGASVTIGGTSHELSVNIGWGTILFATATALALAPAPGSRIAAVIVYILATFVQLF